MYEARILVPLLCQPRSSVMPYIIECLHGEMERREEKGSLERKREEEIA